MSGAAVLDGGQRVDQAQHGVASLLGGGEEFFGQRRSLTRFGGSGQLQGLVANLGRRGVGVGIEVAEHHPAQVMAQQLVEAGDVLLCPGQDKRRVPLYAVEGLGKFGALLKIAASQGVLVPLETWVGPAT
jgi:hypothetical protein